jgi:hypothetical protein
MSDLSAAIYNILANNSDVSGQVATRVIPIALPQNSPIPAVTYWRVSGISINEINGSVSGLARARVTIESYHNSMKEANQLAEYVRLALINARGTYDGTKVRNCLVDTGPQHYTEPPSDGNSVLRYVTAQDFNFHYIEDV